MLLLLLPGNKSPTGTGRHNKWAKSDGICDDCSFCSSSSSCGDDIDD